VTLRAEIQLQASPSAAQVILKERESRRIKRKERKEKRQ
jgi:hypothetical protein